MKKHIKPVLTLTLICLTVSVMLAAVNFVTEPVIAEYEKVQAEKACAEVMPSGSGFEIIPLPENAPSTVTAIYKESGGGYVFKMVTTGFSSGYQIMCGISADGKISGTKVLAHSETTGYGSKTAEKDYTDRYIGEGSSMSENGDDYLISGATKSSKAFRAAISDAFSAFEAIKGEG